MVYVRGAGVPSYVTEAVYRAGGHEPPFEELPTEEVARILGCHVGTSKSQLHKARARLREMLTADGITPAALENG